MKLETLLIIELILLIILLTGCQQNEPTDCTGNIIVNKNINGTYEIITEKDKCNVRIHDAILNITN